MMRPATLLPALATAAALAAAAVAGSASAETLILTGVLTGADHQTYREVPFRVPAGTTSIRVDFAYTGQAEKAVIDLGLRDPVGFRGWSGGNKSRFTVTETWATPSYLPGPLPPGTWKLTLGVPNLRKGGRAEYTARITLDHTAAVFHGFAEAPLKTGPGWYRGDLHTHTGHSDGACASRGGKRTPCPLFKTLEAAAARGLDFVAVTDHNGSAHFQDLAELQGYYDDLLLIPGREVTTFHGHANVLGMTGPLDFELGGPRAPAFARILDEADRARALVSINHPALPSGEACMGCGWTAEVDFARIPAIEVVNGGISSGPLAGIGFWEQRLDAGLRVTAVGGSDNHDPMVDPARGGVGAPTTVVHASNLSQDAVLEAIRAGHVFIDVQGTHERRLEVTATGGGQRAEMGDRLPVGSEAVLTVRVVHAAGGRVSLVGPSAPKTPDMPLTSDDETLTVTAPGLRGWLRVDVRGPDGKLWLLGNPIYFQ